MRFVDDQHAVVTRGDRQEIVERRAVAVHAVEALDGDPRRSRAPRRAPILDRVLERLRIVVACFGALGLAHAHAVVDRRVDQRIVHDEVAALRQRREQREIGDEAAAEEERAFGAEEGRRLRFQRLVLAVIAAQKPRSAGTDRHVALDGGARRGLHFVRGGKAEIVVGGEVGAGDRG